MSGAVLAAKDISVGYGKKAVVSGLSFEVSTGEILTLIGPNGAGKSTILRSTAAQLPLLSGTVTLAGRDMKEMNVHETARKLSVCFTERITAERMNCYDLVATGRYPYTGRLGVLSQEDRRIVQEARELTGITYLAGTDIRCISDGQRQTAMLARAIAQEPEVLILDEPTSFLDISNKLRLLTLLRELVRSRGIAVVQSLHELDLAQRFSDKIVCIRDHKADRTGTPEEIFAGDYISTLYGMNAGVFLPDFGTAEAQRITGEPEVFVIGGGGSGIATYRRLQRQGIPFAAGVIHENDMEYPVARSLASVLVAEKAFEPVSDVSTERALEVMKKCGKVICCTDGFGTMNAGNRRLLEEAQKMGKL